MAMISAIERKWTQTLVVLGTVAIALFLTPSFSSEPVDLPKLFLLVPFSAVLYGLIASYSRVLVEKRYRTVLVISIALLIQFTLVLLLSSSPFNEQFFGTSGRNTGYLAYLGLIGFMLASVYSADESLLKKLTQWLFISGALSSGYGFLQLIKHDPIKWNNPYNPIIAFLGNPDFASAFLGLSAAAGIALIFTKSIKLQWKALIAIYEIFSLFLIVKSHAQQGVLVFGISAALVTIIFLYKTPGIKNLWASSVAGLSVIAGILVTLGIFKVGPLADKLYKFSVRQRGFYWHAGLEMMKSNPIFGIGLDSYGDNYFKYRSANAAFFSRPTQSNAAHNVYLDIASNGGIILFALYILLTIYVLICAVRVFRASTAFNPYFTTVFVAWVGYQAQSIVSINQLGLAIWGWVLGGAVIGYSKLAQNEKSETSKPAPRRASKSKKIDLIFPSIGLAVGLALAIPPFMADHNYRIAASTRDANKVIAAAAAYPEDLGRSLSIAQNLANAKLFPQALTLAKHVAEVSPKNYNAWVMISQLTQPGTPDHANAIKKMQELNPHDKTIN